MNRTPVTRLGLIRSAHGCMYASAVVAGLYGLVQPASLVSDMYGVTVTYVLLGLLSLGGFLGVVSYLTRYIWVELWGIPLMFATSVFAAPALMLGGATMGHRWMGWLCLCLAAAFMARWSDVRALRAYLMQGGSQKV